MRPDPGYEPDKIIWSLNDGSASCDITESRNFSMPAMDAVVYVSKRQFWLRSFFSVLQEAGAFCGSIAVTQSTPLAAIFGVSVKR